MAVMQILQKRGARAPVPEEIEVGEVAINTAAGELYVKTDGGEVVAVGSGGGGTGAGMVISATEPTDKITGMQWMDSTTAIVWVWDDDKWLEFPAGKGGDGATGTYVLPVSLRSGEATLPLSEYNKLEVITRNGPIELPLLAA
jgi:hypothetical protein